LIDEFLTYKITYNLMAVSNSSFGNSVQICSFGKPYIVSNQIIEARYIKVIAELAEGRTKYGTKTPEST